MDGNSDQAVKMTFKNKVTNLKKLEEYEKRLKSLSKVIEQVPNSTNIGDLAKTASSSNKSISNTSKAASALSKNAKGAGAAFIAASVGISLAETALSKVFNTVKKLQNPLTKVFNVLSIIALGQAIKRLMDTIQKYVSKSSEYVENLNLMQVAFKETGRAGDRAAESFVNGLADIFGLDESTMTRQLGFYRQIGNALGVDAEKADLLSKNLLKMQLDMSSLYNLTFEKSGEVLQSAIAGQTKPVRGATGADITQASLQTTLDKLDINRAVSDLSRGEKVLTIYLSLLDQIEESQGDLAKTINSVANQEKIYTEQTQRLSRVLGDVLSVAFGKVLPYMNGFLMVLVEIIEKFAIFVGFKIPTYDVNKSGIGDLADDLEDVANNVKKASTGLRAFDKLNNITTPKSSGKAGAIGGIDPKLLDALEEYDLRLKNIDNKATKVRDALMKWLGFTKEVNEETGEITWKYDTLGKSAETIATEIGTNLAEALNKATYKANFEQYGEKLAKGLNISLSFLTTFVDKYHWDILGDKVAGGINKAISEIDWSNVGKTLTSSFKVIILTLYGFVTRLDFSNVGKALANGLNGAIQNIPWFELTNTLSQLLMGAFDGITVFIENINIDGLVDAFGIAIEGIDIKEYGKKMNTFAKKVTDKMSELLQNQDWKKHMQNLGEKIVEALANVDWEENIQLGFKFAFQLVLFLLDCIKEMLKFFGKKIWQHMKDSIYEWIDKDSEKEWYEIATDLWYGFFTGIGKYNIVSLTEKFIVEPFVDAVLEKFGITGDDKSTVMEAVGGKVINGFGRGLSWSKIEPKLTEIKDKIAGKFGEIAFSIGTTVGDKFKEGMNSVISTIESKFNTGIVANISNWLSKNKIGKAVGGISNIKLPRLKTGIDFVPNDFYPAFLDYGERVLTKEENQAYMNGTGINGTTINNSKPVNATIVVKVGDQEIARKVINDLQDMASANGSPITIG